jgi:hypothetical protein
VVSSLPHPVDLPFLPAWLFLLGVLAGIGALDMPMWLGVVAAAVFGGGGLLLAATVRRRRRERIEAADQATEPRALG